MTTYEKIFNWMELDKEYVVPPVEQPELYFSMLNTGFMTRDATKYKHYLNDLKRERMFKSLEKHLPEGVNQYGYFSNRVYEKIKGSLINDYEKLDKIEPTKINDTILSDINRFKNTRLEYSHEYHYFKDVNNSSYVLAHYRRYLRIENNQTLEVPFYIIVSHSEAGEQAMTYNEFVEENSEIN